MLSESLSLPKNKLMSGERKVNKVCNENIAKNLLKNAEELLGGKLSHYDCCDRTTQHKKYVIEYNHEEKCNQ